MNPSRIYETAHLWLEPLLLAPEHLWQCLGKLCVSLIVFIDQKRALLKQAFEHLLKVRPSDTAFMLVLCSSSG